MRVIIQRVKEASVHIAEKPHSGIKSGLLVFLGIMHLDNEADIDYVVKKLARLRVFSDADGKMNLSVKDVAGQFLVISQFTLFASTKKGNRPSFLAAAPPDVAIPLYQLFLSTLEKMGEVPVKSGVFAADMQVMLINDGPVTIIIDSKQRE